MNVRGVNGKRMPGISNKQEGGGRISRMNRCNLTNEQDPMLALYENKT